MLRKKWKWPAFAAAMADKIGLPPEADRGWKPSIGGEALPLSASGGNCA